MKARLLLAAFPVIFGAAAYAGVELRLPGSPGSQVVTSDVAASPTTEDTPTSTMQATDLQPTATFVTVSSETLVPSPTFTPTPFVYAYGPDDFPDEINPLTGLVMDDPSLLERRPIVIKVTNFPRSVRPQWGLSAADHVYEYYIADDMSRFVGIFYGNDTSRVGPIRSARLFDAHVTRMYNGIFIFGWADDAVLNFLFAPDLKPHLIIERPSNCPPLCRIGPKTAYNTLFADTTQIASYLKTRGTNNERQDLTGLRFEQDALKSGNPGKEILIRYSLISYHRWIYDPQLGRYLRYQETGEGAESDTEYAPLLDALTQEQISASNVLVLLVPHQFFKKSSSTEIVDQPFMGEGTGYAFRDGQIFPIQWTRDEADRLPQFTLPDGRYYPLIPGKTWFELIGAKSLFEQTKKGVWSFEFQTP